MKYAYPVVFSKGKDYIIAFVPDFNISTQGKSYAEAIEMARDAIGLMGIDMEDEHEAVPVPTEIDKVAKEEATDILSLVDVDFAEYRRKNDLRTVRRNVTIPSWLDDEAKKSGANVSAILKRALISELQISNK